MSTEDPRRIPGAWRALLPATALSLAATPVLNAAECPTEGLRAPLGYYQIPEAREDAGDYDCEMVPPHTGDMDFTSKYEGSDSARNELNEAAYQEYLKASENIRGFEKAVIAAADDYQVDGDGPAARDCVLDNLEQWASADALLPENINHVGQAVRKWALAASANAYLRVKLSSSETALEPERMDRIEDWLSRVVGGVREYYTDREPRKVNNHDYWAAWAVMSASVATGNCDDWSWSHAKFDEAMGQITSDGYLPKELSREDRALEYLNYAMQPLTLLAVFAEVNDTPAYDGNRERFVKLAQNVVDGLEEPDRIAAINGHEQITKGLYTGWGLAWMRPWTETWSGLPGMSSFLEEYGPMKSTRLGGDIEFLYGIEPLWPDGTDPFPPTDLRINGHTTNG